MKRIKKRVHKSKKRVKKHKVPKRITEKPLHIRVQTGIPNFDHLIGGGLEKDSTNMLVGSAGAGKSIFATQFLVEGMNKGEKCLYVTFEEKKGQFYRNMLEFGWNLADYEKRGLLTFLEYTPEKVKVMLDEGGGAIESIILSKKIKRIVIDSVTSFELLFGGEFEKRGAALSLFNMINNWGCTSIVTLEEEVDVTSTSKALEFESDSIVLLYFVRNRNAERQRYVEVLKMRGTKHSKKMYRFEMGKNGIIVSKKPYKEIL